MPAQKRVMPPNAVPGAADGGAGAGGMTLANLVANHLTDERVDQIFATLGITPETEPEEAERLLQEYLAQATDVDVLADEYLRLREGGSGSGPANGGTAGSGGYGTSAARAAGSRASSAPLTRADDTCPKVDLLRDYESTNDYHRDTELVNRAMEAQRALAASGQNAQFVELTITGAEGFSASPLPSMVTLHISLGVGRASSEAKPLQREPEFGGSVFRMEIARQPITLVELYMQLRNTPLTVACIERSLDGRSSVYGIAVLPWAEFFSEALYVDSTSARYNSSETVRRLALRSVMLNLQRPGKPRPAAGAPAAGAPEERGVGLLRAEVRILPAVTEISEEMWRDMEASGWLTAAGSTRFGNASAPRRDLVAVLAHRLAQFSEAKASLLQRYDEAVRRFQEEREGVHSQHVGLLNRETPLYALRDVGDTVPACLLIQPLFSRLLPTPRHCARFVQLIPTVSRQFDMARASRQTDALVWSHPHTIFARGAASPEDKAALLCSLFRGFGLPAFVGVGTRHSQAAPGGGQAAQGAMRSAARGPGVDYFVVVLSPTAVQFWDTASDAMNTMTELRYRADGEYEVVDADLVEDFPFDSLDCMFNDVEFFSNNQAENGFRYTRGPAPSSALARGAAPPPGGVVGLVQGPSLDISQRSFWKRFDAGLIDKIYTHLGEVSCPIVGFEHHIALECSEILEDKLWKLIAARRSDLGLPTPKSESLSRVLGPSLLSYESERLAGGLGGCLDNSTFKVAIRNYVRPGQKFSAYPLQVNGPLRFHAPSVLRALISNEVARNIVDAHGDDMRMGLRVEVVDYAETVAAVWVIIGCCYTPVV